MCRLCRHMQRLKNTGVIHQRIDEVKRVPFADISSPLRWPRKNPTADQVDEQAHVAACRAPKSDGLHVIQQVQRLGLRQLRVARATSALLQAIVSTAEDAVGAPP